MEELDDLFYDYEDLKETILSNIKIIYKLE